MTWREVKGEEKWVSVPQAEGRVTDFLVFLLPSFLGKKRFFAWFPRGKAQARGCFLTFQNPESCLPVLHSITAVVSAHNQIRVARASQGTAFTFSPSLRSPLTSQQCCTNDHMWPLPALFSIVRYIKTCCWQIIRIN